MKANPDNEFSWPTLFLVTSCSFLGFGGIIKLIHGSPEHAAIFLKIGVGSLILFILGLCWFSMNKSSKVADD